MWVHRWVSIISFHLDLQYVANVGKIFAELFSDRAAPTQMTKICWTGCAANVSLSSYVEELRRNQIEHMKQARTLPPALSRRSCCMSPKLCFTSAAQTNTFHGLSIMEQRKSQQVTTEKCAMLSTRAKARASLANLLYAYLEQR